MMRRLLIYRKIERIQRGDLFFRKGDQNVFLFFISMTGGQVCAKAKQKRVIENGN